MKVSGFTFIRNAIIYDYPIVEAIRSILPLCHEVVVAVGKSEDETLALIQNIDPQKVKIIETAWDDSLRKGGRVLAEETDKAYRATAADADWAFYIQGDEVFHEADTEKLRAMMLRYKDDVQTDGLLFDYLHFYGSYDYYGSNSRWYPHEVRVVRRRADIFSFQDAQGFRRGENEKLRVRKTGARIFHYGWVKPPDIQQKKRENFNKYWHSDVWMEKNIAAKADFSYAEGMHTLKRFEGEHPEVMREKIARQNWEFDGDISFNHTPLKDKMKAGLKRYLGLDFSYRNYKLL